MTSDPSRIIALDEWIRGKEGENLEFKSARTNFHFDELTKYCVALANEGGGKIILGVTDERPRQIVGSKAFAQPERTRKGLCERIPLGIDFEEIDHPDCASGSRVLIFMVPSRPVGMAIQYNGHRWVRKEDSLIEMSDDRLREIYAESGHDFSADICRGVSLSDLDADAIRNFRERWIAKAKKAEDQEQANRVQSLGDAQLLEDVEAIVDGQVTYSDHLKVPVRATCDINSEVTLHEHFIDCRREFYSAESLRTFSRDTLPPGEFERLQEEMHSGIKEEVRADHSDGYRRVLAAVKMAKLLQITDHALIGRLSVRDRGGICHQLANDKKVRWTK